MPFHTQTSATAPTSRLGGGGLDFITSTTFSTVASVSLDGCFSNSYENYRIVVTNWQSATSTAATWMRLRASGTDSTSADYAQRGTSTQSVVNVYNLSGDTKFDLGCNDTSTPTGGYVITVIRPQIAAPTLIVSQFFGAIGATLTSISMGGYHSGATAFDGFTLQPTSGNITSGTARVFGYRNA